MHEYNLKTHIKIQYLGLSEYGGMSFKHLYGFNLSMLGKQRWKFSTQEDAMVTKIFKSKYFPNGEILGSQIKSQS